MHYIQGWGVERRECQSVGKSVHFGMEMEVLIGWSLSAQIRGMEETSSSGSYWTEYSNK